MVRKLYKDNPKLNTKFVPIKAVPLESRLSQNTKQLRQWLHHVKHQIKVSQAMQGLNDCQLTLMQAFQRGGSAHSR
jgi:hypothetical protein